MVMVDNTPAKSPSSLPAFGGEAGSVLRLIPASSQCQFRASDGVQLNVECFGPKYFGGGGNENNDASSNAGGDNSMHKRSMHNSDEWPLVREINM